MKVSSRRFQKEFIRFRKQCIQYLKKNSGKNRWRILEKYSRFLELLFKVFLDSGKSLIKIQKNLSKILEDLEKKTGFHATESLQDCGHNFSKILKNNLTIFPERIRSGFRKTFHQVIRMIIFSFLQRMSPRYWKQSLDKKHNMFRISEGISIKLHKNLLKIPERI